MYALGLPTTVTIDDYLPWMPEPMNKAPFLRPGPDKALWGPLIEKAFAKFHGSYESIIGGNPAEGVRYLTGAPATELIHDTEMTEEEKKKFWNRIVQGFEEGNFVTCGSWPSGTDK